LSDEPEMEHSLHFLQLVLLFSCLERLWKESQNYFLGANLTIYYNRDQLKTKDFRGPDLFLVKGVEKRLRSSWVVWEEGGKYPDLIIELLSDSTAKVDRIDKRELYQDTFRTREYFYFSPETLEFMGLRLMGPVYQEIPATEQGWRWSEELQLYLGIHNQQLRFFFPNGELVPTPEEAEQTEQQRAEQERQRAEQERQRAERLAQKLRELGVDPATLEEP
ncbi:MAG: Uma2 family endonuclease, partial [Thermostichus sp. BF3_bins_97]